MPEMTDVRHTGGVKAVGCTTIAECSINPVSMRRSPPPRMPKSPEDQTQQGMGVARQRPVPRLAGIGVQISGWCFFPKCTIQYMRKLPAVTVCGGHAKNSRRSARYAAAHFSFVSHAAHVPRRRPALVRRSRSGSSLRALRMAWKTRLVRSPVIYRTLFLMESATFEPG